MLHAKLLIGIAFLSTLLISGCGLLGSDDENGPEEISLEDLPGTLVFSARDDEQKNQIFTMRPDGSELTQLTFSDFEYYDPGGHDTRGFDGWSPSWSPDGSQVVFVTFYKSTTAGPTLWIMNADGSDSRPLYDPDPDDPHNFPIWGNNPNWSPDGTKIAFWRCVGCSISTNYAIYVFNLETEELTRLTEEPIRDTGMYLTWSPDGSQIAFTTNRDYMDADTLRFRKDLYVIGVDGSDQTRLTTSGNVSIPSWQPNGDLIAYAWQHNIPDVFLFNIITGETQKLTDLKYVGRPMWSNDGLHLLIPGTTNQNIFVLQYIDISGNVIVEEPVEIEYIMGMDWFIN